MDFMTYCDRMIANCNIAICNNLNRTDAFDRGMLSVNILSQLRNLIDNIGVKLYLSTGKKPSSNQKYYDLIVQGNKLIDSQGQLRVLKQLHGLLQISASHYTLDPENSERLMLKYYVYLWRIRKFMAQRFNINILNNLERFPLNTDQSLKQYYAEIANVFENLDLTNAQTFEKRFYIYKTHPIIINDTIYYEVTLTLANERTSKFDQIIAFTKHELLPYYASRLRMTMVEINISGIQIPIMLVLDWEPSIRLCEIKNLGKIFGLNIPNSQTKEYLNLMNYLKKSLCSLTETVNLRERDFRNVLSLINKGAKTKNITNLLIKCHELIKSRKDGHNVVRYLMYRMNNKIIRSQYDSEPCHLLSNLNLKLKSKPFDRMPFSFSLFNHNPKFGDLIESIPNNGHESEFLARHLCFNAEHAGLLYTPVDELDKFGDLNPIIEDYNKRLYPKHAHAAIELYKEHAFIKNYESNVHEILLGLSQMTHHGIDDYHILAETWLKSFDINIDCEEKSNAIKHLFSDSRVAFVYGAAGTGKTTFIKYISQIFADNTKLYVANTNPAVDNLRRKVNTANASYMTIASFLAKRVPSCDILFIDECSTVSNEDMLAILNKGGFRLLVLVGDMYQIEAIRFGNWFSISHSHFSGRYVVELQHQYRTSDHDLLTTWEKVRTLSPDILEYITRNDYSSNLNETLFSKFETDEIILCLNYGGLYGINNINRILQRNNPNPPIQWGIHTFKIGDPVLFNESNRFTPYLHNNLKGEIIDITIQADKIYFTLQVDKILSSFDLEDSNIEFISTTPDGNSTIIKISAEEEEDNDQDMDNSESIIPFQIAYAVSIHKAQGLEYQSVKIIITRDVEEMITHNIFYTAITRSKCNLKIYWTPETEKYVLEHLKQQFNKKDYFLLKSRYSDL